MAQNPYQQALAGLSTITNRAVPGSRLMPDVERLRPGLDLPGGEFGSEDPSVQLHGLQGALQEDFGTRAIQAARAGDMEDARGFGRYSDQYAEDQRTSPIALQGLQVAQDREAQREAYSQGFGHGIDDSIVKGPTSGAFFNVHPGSNPVAAQQAYGRQQAAIKAQQPLDIARIQQEGALAQQKEQSGGARDVAQINADALRDINNPFAQMLAGGALPNNVTRLSGGRTPSISFGQQNSTQRIIPLLRDVTVARRNLSEAQSGTGGLDLRGQGAAKAATAETAYRQALGQVFGTLNVDPAMQEFVTNIATHPRLRDLPLSQLQADPEVAAQAELDQITPQEWAQINQLLNYSRGIPGQEF